MSDFDSDTNRMREEFRELFREYQNNKSQVKELNSRNTDIVRYLDKEFQLEKGTTKEYFVKKLREEDDKDRTEDVLELETLLNE